MLAAAILRIKWMVDHRNLFLDEANVALNISERSWFSLLGNLDYGQHFPPLPLVIIKGIVSVFGNSETSLRSLSLIAGLLSLWLFYVAIRKVISHPWFPLFIIGFSMFIIRYQTELKQYSLDLFVSVLFVYFLFHFKTSSKKAYLYLGLVGMLAIWSSMPAVFLLIGVAVYCLPMLRHHISSLLLIGFTWCLVFGALYMLNLRYSLGSEHLQDFHQAYFFQCRFSGEGLLHNFRLFEHFLGAWIGSKTVSVVSSLLLVFLGFFRLWKLDKWAFYAVLAVFVSTCLVSGFQYYSMIPRVLFFWIPLILLLMGFGFDQCWDFLAKRLKSKVLVYSLLLLFFVLPNVIYRSAIPSFWNKFTIEQPKELMIQWQKEIKENDVIYLTKYGRPAFEYYSKHHKKPVVFKQETINTEDYQSGIREAMIHRESKNSSIWLFDTHVFVDETTLANKLIGASKLLQSQHSFAAKYD